MRPSVRLAEARAGVYSEVLESDPAWPFEFTEDVLVGHTPVRTFWNSLASLTALLNLLVNSVAAQLGRKAVERFPLLADWGEHFGEVDAVTSRSAELQPKRR